MNCLECGIEFSAKRSDAKYCSPRCKKIAFDKRSLKNGSVTDNVTFKEPVVTDNFEFTVPYNRKPGDLGYDEEVSKNRNTHRVAKYWYDVPLGAIPAVQKGQPPMPEFMNGRQYFLWWKNNFKMTDKGPELYNPFNATTKKKL